MSNMEVTWNKTSGNSGELTFKSDVEGVATTYANLYRRALLQSTPNMAVAAIRCKVDGSYSKNLFQLIPGMTDSLIDVNSKLHNATFNITNKDVDSFILSFSLSGKVMLSDICDNNKCTVVQGDIDLSEIELISEDAILTSVVGNHNIVIDIFFKNGVGYLQRDVNTQSLEAIVGQSEVGTWIVTDSQHRGVVSVTYNCTNRLGKQIIVLGVTSFQNNIEEVISNCTDLIKSQLDFVSRSVKYSVE